MKNNIGTASPSPRGYYLRRQPQQQGPQKQQHPEVGSRSNDDGDKLEAEATPSLTLPPPLPRYPTSAVARYASRVRDGADNDGCEQSGGQGENKAESGGSSNNNNNNDDDADDVATSKHAEQGVGDGGGDGVEGGETPSTGAGREMSDIDRRLGELHDFLRRAKAAGSTGSVGSDGTSRADSGSGIVRREPTLERLRSLAGVDNSLPAEERPLTPLAHEQDGIGEGGAGGEEHEEDGQASLISQQDSVVSSQGVEAR